MLEITVFDGTTSCANQVQGVTWNWRLRGNEGKSPGDEQSKEMREWTVGQDLQEDLNSSVVMTRAQTERKLQTNSLGTWTVSFS